jgi:hypothetical protein
VVRWGVDVVQQVLRHHCEALLRRELLHVVPRPQRPGLLVRVAVARAIELLGGDEPLCADPEDLSREAFRKGELGHYGGAHLHVSRRPLQLLPAPAPATAQAQPRCAAAGGWRRAQADVAPPAHLELDFRARLEQPRVEAPKHLRNIPLRQLLPRFSVAVTWTRVTVD